MNTGNYRLSGYLRMDNDSRKLRHSSEVARPQSANRQPSSQTMRDGEEIIFRRPGKPLGIFRKVSGLMWYTYMTRNGDQRVDRDCLVKNDVKAERHVKAKGNLEAKGHIEIDDLTVVNDSRQQTSNLYTIIPLTFGYNAQITENLGVTTTDARTTNGAENTQGYRLLTDGKVLGISLQFRCTSAGEGTLQASVQKNAANQSMSITSTISGSTSNDIGASSTANQFTVAANDKINVELELTETAGGANLTVEDIAIIVHVLQGGI